MRLPFRLVALPGRRGGGDGGGGGGKGGGGGGKGGGKGGGGGGGSAGGPAPTWVVFDGNGVPAIAAQNNVTSITDNAVGDYTVNYTTALADANYAIVSYGKFNVDVGNHVPAVTVADTGPLAGSVRINTVYPFDSTFSDIVYISLIIGKTTSVWDKWVALDASSGTPTILDDSGVASITDNGVGEYTINYDSSFPDTNYCVGGCSYNGTSDRTTLTLKSTASSFAVGSVRVVVSTIAVTVVDLAYVSVVAGQRPGQTWGVFNGTGTPAYITSSNLDSSITDNGDGDYTVAITTDMPSANYASGGLHRDNDADGVGASYMGLKRVASNPAAGTLRVQATTNGVGVLDPQRVHLFLFGG